MKPNWNNQSVFIGDNIDIMRAMNTESVDQICTDPPFNKNKRFDHVFEKGKRTIGFEDAWTMDDARKEEFEDLRKWKPTLFRVCQLAGLMHSRGLQGYLVFMATRLIECHRLLKETGSMYLHCDHSANTYLRMLMDGIFGEKNFMNEIVWHYSNLSAAKRHFPRKHDTILVFAKKKGIHTFNPDDVRVPYAESSKNRVKYKGSGFAKKAKGSWINKDGKIPDSVWEIPLLKGNERSGWATQKPLALYSRMILASSNPGDIVFDPFCGCATTLVAAENAGRQWVGCDRHPEAKKQIIRQLEKLNEGSVDWQRKVHIIEGAKMETRRRRSLTPKRKKLVTPYLYTKQNGICPGCENHVERKFMDIEHDRPIAKGGDDDIGNLQLLCRNCNAKKGTGTLEELKAKLKSAAKS